MKENTINIKYFYWIPFTVIITSFFILFIQRFSSPTGVMFSEIPHLAYWRYLSYFVLIGVLLAIALLKTTRLNKAKAFFISITISSIPLLAFRGLFIMVPYKGTELSSILYEMIFVVLFILVLFYLVPNLFKLKKLSKFSFSDEDVTAWLIIASLVFLWRSCLNNFLLTGDSLKLFTAGAHPLTKTWNYWFHIFTFPFHGEAQYRPLSYFVIYYFMKSVFGNVVWPFQLLGVLLAILIGKLFFNLIRQINRHYLIALLASCYLICHPAFVSLMMQPNHVAKYLFPLVTLILGLLWVKRSLIHKTPYIIATILLSVLSIMSHEGSFVFPLVLILFDFSIHKKILKSYGLLIMPSFVYFLIRFFYFRVPNKGFMEVDFLTVTKYLPQWLEYILVPEFLIKGPMITLLFLCLCLSWFSFCLFYIDKKYYWAIAIFFISTIIILGPFSVLKNHFHLNRSIWGIVPMVLLISIVAKNIQNKNFQILFCGIFFIQLLTQAYSSFIQLKINQKTIFLQMQNQQQLKMLISKQLKSGTPVFIPIDYYKIPKYPNRVLALAGFLANNFPKEEFTLQYLQRKKPSFFIKHGLLLRRRGKQWKDLFAYETKVKIPEKSLMIHIDSKMIAWLRVGEFDL